MKTLLLAFLSIFIQLSGFAQLTYKTIAVSKDIELIKISDNAYMHVSYTELPSYGRASANGFIYINGEEAFLFDSPWNDSLTADLYSWITDSMKLKIVGFIPNHWHVDCMGGLNFLLKQKIESFASQMTIDIAKSKNLTIPAHGFSDSLQLQLGDKIIKCYYLGAAHSLDNIVVWIPSEKILFAGCIVKNLYSKDLGNTADGDLTAYPKTIDKLMNKFPTTAIVIPGHGQLGGFELLEHTKTLSSK